MLLLEADVPPVGVGEGVLKPTATPPVAVAPVLSPMLITLLGGLVAVSLPKSQLDQSTCWLADVGEGTGVAVTTGVGVITV